MSNPTNNNTLLFRVDLDEGKTEARAKALRAEIQRLREEKKALDVSFKAGQVDATGYADRLHDLETATKAANTELRDQTKTLEQQAKVRTAATGSLEQTRAKLSLLNAEYIKLSKTEKESATGVGFKNQIKGISDALKDEEKAIGDNRRNVGNYAETIEQAIRGQAGWTGQIKGTIASLKENKSSLTDMVSGIRATSSGLEGAKKASFAFGLSLKAVGIGLIITAIAGLISFLTKFDAGMDLVDRTTARVTATVSEFARQLAPLGKLLVDVFTSPLETLGKIIKGTDEYSVSLNGAAAAANAAGNAAAEYTQKINDLNDEQDQLIGKQALVNQQVALALLAVKDQSKTQKERIALLDAAGVQERKLAADQLRIARDRLFAEQKVVLSRVEGEKAALQIIRTYRAQDLLDYITTGKNKEKYDDADRKRLNEGLAALVAVHQQTNEVEQQVQNRRSALIEQEKSRAKAAAAEAKTREKEAAADRVARAELELLGAKARGLDTLAYEKQLIEKRTQLELVDAKGRNGRALIAAKERAEILAAELDHAIRTENSALTTQEAKLQARIQLAEKGSDAELSLQVQLSDALRVRAKTDEINRFNALAKAGKLTENALEEHNANLLNIDAKFNTDVESLEKTHAQNLIAHDNDLAKTRIEIAADLGDKSRSEVRNTQRDLVALEEETANKVLAVQLEAAKKAGLATVQLEEEIETKRAAVKAKAAATQKQLDHDEYVESLKNRKDVIDRDLHLTTQGSRARVIALQNQVLAERDIELSNEALTKAAREDIIKQSNDKIRALYVDYVNSRIGQVIEVAAQVNTQVANVIEAAITAQIKGLDRQQKAALSGAALSAEQRTAIEADFQQKREALEKKAAEKRKVIALAEVVINTARGIAAQLALVPVSIPLIALAAAIGTAQALVIESQQFARGGVIDGPSHAQGGVKYRLGNRMVELEGDEGVINKRSMGIPGVRQIASQLNQLGGGIAFPGTAPLAAVNYVYEHGGVLPANGMGVDASQLAAMVKTGVAEALQQMPPIYTVATEVRDSINTVQVRENRADH